MRVVGFNPLYPDVTYSIETILHIQLSIDMCSFHDILDTTTTINSGQTYNIDLESFSLWSFGDPLDFNCPFEVIIEGAELYPWIVLDTASDPHKLVLGPLTA
jgi:hypothetical protein